jgi:hypothetical protein
MSPIPVPTQRALRSLEWLERRENLVVRGASGTGKIHFLEALGHVAIDAGRKVAWFSLEDLGGLVRRHRADDTVTKAVRRILRVDLVVIDDIGLLPVPTNTAEALVPSRRRRLRTPLRRAELELAPRRLRRAHAQDHRQRHRRPAFAPCPSRRHRRRLAAPLRLSTSRRRG